MLPSLEERRETPIWKRSPAIPRPFFSVPAASLWEDTARPAPSATTRLNVQLSPRQPDAGQEVFSGG